jgi:hypothetical protein
MVEKMNDRVRDRREKPAGRDEGADEDLYQRARPPGWKKV